MRIGRLNISIDPKPQKLKDKNIEKALTIDGETFYRFIDTTDITTYARWTEAQRHLQSFERFRMSGKALREWSEAYDKAANRGQMGLCLMLKNQLMERQEALTDIELTYQVSAQVLFKLTDNLDEIVSGYELNRRVNLFKKKDIKEFILIEPICSLLAYAQLLKSYSPDALLLMIKANAAQIGGLSKFWRKTAEKYSQ